MDEQKVEASPVHNGGLALYHLGHQHRGCLAGDGTATGQDRTVQLTSATESHAEAQQQLRRVRIARAGRARPSTLKGGRSE